MDQTNNGGPAFPAQEQIDYPSSSVMHYYPGMSLRDYFAAHTVIDPELSVRAAETLLGRKMPDYAVVPVEAMQFWAEVGARLRYIHADAMLAARGAA